MTSNLKTHDGENLVPLIVRPRMSQNTEIPRFLARRVEALLSHPFAHDLPNALNNPKPYNLLHQKLLTPQIRTIKPLALRP